MILSHKQFNGIVACFMSMYEYECDDPDRIDPNYKSEYKQNTDNVLATIKFIAENKNKKCIILTDNDASIMDSAFNDLWNYIDDMYQIMVSFNIYIPDPVEHTFTKPEYIGNIHTAIKDGISPADIYWPGFGYFDPIKYKQCCTIARNELVLFNHMVSKSKYRYTYKNITYDMSRLYNHCLYIKMNTKNIIKALELISSMTNSGRMIPGCSITMEE
jgi:hypothetical protein